MLTGGASQLPSAHLCNRRKPGVLFAQTFQAWLYKMLRHDLRPPYASDRQLACSLVFAALLYYFIKERAPRCHVPGGSLCIT